MAIQDTGPRRLRLTGWPTRSALVRMSRGGLALSALMLAAAPLAVADSYSVVENTLSESGGQGVGGAWVFRAGVLVAAASVLVMTSVPSPWASRARAAMRIYAFALVLLVVWPESAWDGRSADLVVAKLHTVSGVIGAVAFMLGVLVVSHGRQHLRARVFDWVVVAAVALVPQVMLLTVADGLWQRLMVALGYAWLLIESLRISSPRPAPPPST